MKNGHKPTAFIEHLPGNFGIAGLVRFQQRTADACEKQKHRHQQHCPAPEIQKPVAQNFRSLQDFGSLFTIDGNLRVRALARTWKHHPRPPERKQGGQGPRNVAERHFAGALQSGAMPDAGFRDGIAQLPCARQHFRVDEKAWGFGEQFLQDAPAKHFQGTVTITNAGPKKGADQDVITPGKEPPGPRVLSVEPIADGNRMPLGQRNQGGEVGQMELAIGIGESDALISRGFKAGAQGGAVPEIALVSQQAYLPGHS